MPLGAARFGLLGGVADLGKLELIETQTVSTAVTTVDFTTIYESTYNVHFLTFNNVQTSGGIPNDGFRLYESGVLETASVYQDALQYGNTTGTSGEAKSTARNKLINFNGASGDSDLNGYCYFYNLGDSSKYSFLTHHNFSVQAGGGLNTWYYEFGSAVLPQASTVDGIQYAQDITNGIQSGTFSLYGIAES